MSLVGNITKVWAAKKLLLFLTKDITQLQAFKLGIIDAQGNQIIKRKDMDQKQKDAFGPYEKICLYVRRVLKNHGVASLAIALTYIEEEKYDEFMLHFKEIAGTNAEVVPAGGNQYSDLIGTVPVNAPPSHQQTDDFDRNVMLLEQILLADEDAPTTSTGGIAGYDVPFRREKNKDYEA
uniref:Uncharacterized protein n=1 Tax=Ochrobactrum phage ORM_20 TaxID=2985243 RepID=A0A9N6ZFY1_9VIRU|nr:hypothetical protein ORM20_00014 [Ochrobactrum phage ORM_20]